ncbi:MAG: PDZ domain-containing protein [Lachnospiraceae bacterium]|nr:PDZ domain-containing protein [Lachnospiraceae bacterium]
MEPADNKPYIRETIEGKPPTPLWKKLLLTVFLALVFGAVAAITFVFGKDLAARFIGTTEAETAESVIFPPDDPQHGGSESRTAEESAVATEGEVTTEAETTDSSEPTEETPEETEDPAEQLKAMMESMIAADQPDLADIRLLYRAASSLAADVSRSLTAVSFARKGQDAFGTEYTYDEQSFGIIIASTSREILILTPYTENALTDGSVSVKFYNGTTANAYAKSTDKVSGLAVLAVTVRGLDDSTKEKIKVADLGSSYLCSVGQPVIALGAPTGTSGSLRYSILTHVSEDVAAVDNNIWILHTDMTSFDGSRGVLVDLNGKVVGWFNESLAQNGLIGAVGISDIKSYLQNMSNGLSTAYLGITGQSMTTRLKEQLSVKEDGVFVLSCLDDGPAMTAGLMSGDIITAISGEPVINMAALRTRLLDMNTEQTVKISVLRRSGSGYQPLEFDVHLEQR